MQRFKLNHAGVLIPDTNNRVLAIYDQPDYPDIGKRANILRRYSQRRAERILREISRGIIFDPNERS